MIDQWHIRVFRYSGDDRDCLQLWLDEIERKESLAIRRRVEGRLDALLLEIRNTRHRMDLYDQDEDFWPLTERGDSCDGIDEIRINLGGKVRRVLGVFLDQSREFVVFLAANKDDIGDERNNPDFYRRACPEVNARMEALEDGEGELVEFEI